MSAQPDLTTTQKIYLPIAKLHDGHHRVVARMVQAYGQGDQQMFERALYHKELIERKMQEAYRRARQYFLVKSADKQPSPQSPDGRGSQADGGERSLGMVPE